MSVAATSTLSDTKAFNYRTMLICFLGLIGAGLIPTLVMRALGWENGFWLVANMWRGEGGGDSWEAIAGALRHLDAQGTIQFYENMYYNSSHQFIYSPLSLIFFRVTQFPPLIDWYSSDRMNDASWWVMLAMILVMTSIMRVSIMKFGRAGSAPDVLQTIGMAFLATITVSTFFPLTGGFRNGQIQTWLDFLAMLSLLLLLLDRRALAGVCIGLICVIKPQLAIMFAWAAMRRDWRFLVAGITVAGLFGIASLIAYGWQFHADYLTLLGVMARRGESYASNQTINGFLSRMFFLGPNAVFDPTHTHIIYNVWVQAATNISGIAMYLCAVFIRSPRDTLAGALDFCTAVVLLTLASPVAHTHHYGLILPVFWMVLIGLRSSSGHHILLYGLFWLSYALFANSYAIFVKLADTHWNFLQSMPMFGAFILLAALYRIRFGPMSLALRMTRAAPVAS